MTNSYDIGDTIRLSMDFTVDDVAVDPSGVTFELRAPDGTTTTYEYNTDVEVEKDAVGSYHVDHVVDSSGWWNYRIFASGSASAAEEGTFKVRRQKVS